MSIQVARDLLMVQDDNVDRNVRMLTYLGNTGVSLGTYKFLTRKFKVTDMAGFVWQRHRFSLCNLNNSFVFITGGRDERGNPVPLCERLSIT